MKLEQLLFVGLNGRVAALERTTGELIWEWTSKESNQYVSMLVDRELLFVSVNGYTYALDPLTGEQLWHNPLTGYGLSPAAMATVQARTSDTFLTQARSDILNKSS